MTAETSASAANVLVVLDAPGESLRKAQLELLSAGRIVGGIAVASTGPVSDGVRAQLAEYGASTVFVPEGADLSQYLVGPTAAWLAPPSSWARPPTAPPTRPRPPSPW